MAKFPANKNGIPFGAYCITSNGFPCRVAGRSDRSLTFVETWSPYLFGSTELGDTYTSDLSVIDKHSWHKMVLDLGYKNTEGHDSRLKEFDKAS
jgi:hypothetical protein